MTDDGIVVLAERMEWPDSPHLEGWCRDAARAALAGAGAPQDAALTVLLTDDATVRDLNRRFRLVDRPTNVLAFAGEGRPWIGEMALAGATVGREAAEQSKTVRAHLCHLVVHGTLHLLGFDHRTDGEAERMEALETSILEGLAIEDPHRPDDRGSPS